MENNFNSFFEKYKKIHKKYSKETSLMSFPWEDKVLLFVIAVVFLLSVISIYNILCGNRSALVIACGIGNSVCTILLFFLFVKSGTKRNKNESDMKRIEELHEMMCDVGLNCNGSEIRKDLIAYIRERIDRRNPFSCVNDAIRNTGVAAALIVSFFAGSQVNDIDLWDSILYIIIFVIVALGFYLALAACKPILESIFYPEKSICCDLIDDLNDLALFNHK